MSTKLEETMAALNEAATNVANAARTVSNNAEANDRLRAYVVEREDMINLREALASWLEAGNAVTKELRANPPPVAVVDRR